GRAVRVDDILIEIKEADDGCSHGRDANHDKAETAGDGAEAADAAPAQHQQRSDNDAKECAGRPANKNGKVGGLAFEAADAKEGRKRTGDGHSEPGADGAADDGGNESEQKCHDEAPQRFLSSLSAGRNAASRRAYSLRVFPMSYPMVLAPLFV